jgi:hypothetical protein
MEDEKLISPDTKNYSKEHEVILRKESILNSFDKFELFFNNINEDEEFTGPFNKASRFSINKKQSCRESFRESFVTFPSEGNLNVGNFTPNLMAGSPEDDYNLLKSMPVNFSEEQGGKTRANSILRLLEINLGEKRKASNCDI